MFSHGLDILCFQEEANKCVRFLGGWGKGQKVPMREGKKLTTRPEAQKANGFSYLQPNSPGA